MFDSWPRYFFLFFFLIHLSGLFHVSLLAKVFDPFISVDLVKCNLTTTSLVVKQFMSLAVKRFTSLVVKRFMSVVVKQSMTFVVKWLTRLAVKQSLSLVINWSMSGPQA